MGMIIFAFSRPASIQDWTVPWWRAPAVTSCSSHWTRPASTSSQPMMTTTRKKRRRSLLRRRPKRPRTWRHQSFEQPSDTISVRPTASSTATILPSAAGGHGLTAPLSTSLSGTSRWTCSSATNCDTPQFPRYWFHLFVFKCCCRSGRHQSF